MGDRNFKILVPDGNNEYQSQGRLLESGFEHTCQKFMAAGGDVGATCQQPDRESRPRTLSAD